MTTPLPEPTAIESPPSVEGAVADTAEAVAAAVADVTTEALAVLVQDNASLRSRCSELESKVMTLSEELAESRKEPDVTLVVVEETPAEPATEPTSVEPSEDDVTVVEPAGTPPPVADKPQTDSKPKRRPRRGLYGR